MPYLFTPDFLVVNVKMMKSNKYRFHGHVNVQDLSCSALSSKK
jgi:hypothetical protein